MSGSRPAIVTFWHGPLSWLERLCLGSFVRQGHAVELYSYDPVPDLPAGVVRRDAAGILPRERLFFYKGSRTPAVFADLFRLKLLEAGRGIWADADVYCLRPFAGLPDHLFAYEVPPGPDGRGGSVNGAVLRLPADSGLLADMLAVFAGGRPPLLEPHLPVHRRLEVAAKRLLGIEVPPEYMQYGATGPAALTYHLRRRGLMHLVLPAETFYPVPYEGIPALMRPGSSIDTAVTDRTYGIHIWRSQLTGRGRTEMPPPVPGSALEALCRRDGVVVG